MFRRTQRFSEAQDGTYSDHLVANLNSIDPGDGCNILFRRLTTDVQQAYLQSAESLQKEIFLRTDALELGSNEFLQLVLPLYGLSESGDYWGETLTAHHLTGIQFEQSAIDLSLFFKRIGRRLVGLSGTYVDDLLRAAHPEVREFLEDTIRKDFDCKESKSITTGRPAQTFLGLDIARTNDGFYASMQKYIGRLAELAPTASFEEYRRLRAQLLWVCNARPDICAFLSFCSSITPGTFSGKDVKDINGRVHYLRETNQEVSLKFPQLDVNTLHLLVYTDASFGTRLDKGSQAGYVCLLEDGSKR
jgi:hypothetical protein